MGDVTGDGRDDVATMILDPDGPDGCRAFLWLEHSGEEGEDSASVLAIDQEGMEVGGAGNLPRAVALLEIDGRPGAEVVAIVVMGAATEFAAVFSFGSGSLTQLLAEGGETFGGLFPHGGGAAQHQASDCTQEGGVVASRAILPDADADRYLVTRTFFDREEETFLADLSRTEVHQQVAAHRLRRFPEFARGLFASCPAA